MGVLKEMPKKAYISPSPKAYAPVALEREVALRNQIKWDEQTIIWGERDDLPLLIMNAVNQSPTATSCLGTWETFLAGSGFTDEGLMTHVIDKDGTTLWDFHCQIAPYMTLLEAFAVNFKFDRQGKITNSYLVGAESCRFVRPADGSKKINFIKLNPYFGTVEYNNEYTHTFPVFDLVEAKEQVKVIDDKYQGQIYFWGTVRPPFKFYPVPRYWSGEKWIYVDAKIPEFHNKNTENGFFQSTLINVIGDPNQPSKNPKYQTKETGTDGTVRQRSTKTVGEEFDEQMSTIFSGTRKAGTAMVLWSLNKDQAINLQAFPVNAQADVFSQTLTDAMRGITTATRVPAILANLPQQGSSLGSDGNSIKAAIDLMHSNVQKSQATLEHFYNKIMLPNLQKAVKQEVKIRNYIPIQTQVTVEDKFWNVAKDTEKRAFVKGNIPGFAEVLQDGVTVDPETGEEQSPAETKVNDKITNLTGRQLQQLNRVTRQFAKGEITFEQAKMLLKNGFGFDDLDVNTWLAVEAVEE